MKKVVLFLVVFFIFTVNVNALPLEDEFEIVNLESNNLEYSLVVEKNTITSEIIKIRNKLDEAIEISESRSTCECIEIDIEPQTVEIDGIFEAEITFDSKGVSQDTEEIVYILTNNIKYEVIRLVVLVKVK